jgi:hypothetical protein
LAYLRAQKLKEELAYKASIAKAKATEIEEIRVLRISKVVKEMGHFRKGHDVNFRRWNAKYTIVETVEDEVV